MTDNPWQRLPDRPPFVLPEDAAVVREFNAQVTEHFFLRVDDLLPEPFVGDPKAPVVLLGTNPRFSTGGRSARTSRVSSPGCVAI